MLNGNLNDHFERFLSEMPGQSATNLRNYRWRLRTLLAAHGEDDPKTISRADINVWHTGMLALGHAPATNAGYRQALKGFFNWLVKAGVLVASPADHLGTGSFRPQRVKLPNEADVVAVTAVAREWLVTAVDYVSVRRATLWLYALESGARLSGLHWLPLAEVKRTLGQVVSGGVYSFVSIEKGRSVTHVVGAEVADALRVCLHLRPPGGEPAYFVRSSEPIKRLTKHSMHKDFETIAKAAGVVPIYPHTLRHRMGDLVTRELSPKIAQAKLNHTSLKTTLEWYHEASHDDVAAATAAARIPPPVGVSEAVEFARLFGVIE